MSCQQAMYAALEVFIFGSLLYLLWPRGKLPPGISGPLALFELPSEKVWLKTLELNNRYGDIACGHLFGNYIIVIGSAQIAEELLEKRSTNYSDRPHAIMSGELCGWSKIMLLSKCDEWFRTHRKWIAQEIGSYAVVQRFHGMIEFETRRYLRDVLREPSKAQGHVHKLMTSITLRLSYGYETRDGDDPLVNLAHKANCQLSRAVSPGNYYVDFVSILKYFPSWLPGAGFKRRAREYAAVANDFAELPHRFTKSQLVAGTALPSLASRLLSQPGLTSALEDSIKWATATIYQGGSDAPSSVAFGLFLAMTLHPRVLKRAQAELDAVVGTDRLPTFSDRRSLPYMEALFTELLRWHGPAPITVRSTRVDDIYDGYLIPASSYVVVNIWAILRDERTYTNPLEFRPERFLGENPETHPGKVAFGFGRRRCPGYFLSNSSVWLMCAQTLAVFDISKCVEDGVEVTPQKELVGEILCHLAPFKCAIKPRSAQAEALVRQDFLDGTR